MVGLGSRVLQRSPDVLGFQIGKILENLSLGNARRQKVEYIHNPDAHPANAGTPAALLGVESNPVEVTHADNSPISSVLSKFGRFVRPKLPGLPR